MHGMGSLHLLCMIWAVYTYYLWYGQFIITMHGMGSLYLLCMVWSIFTMHGRGSLYLLCLVWTNFAWYRSSMPSLFYIHESLPNFTLLLPHIVTGLYY